MSENKSLPPVDPRATAGEPATDNRPPLRSIFQSSPRAVVSDSRAHESAAPGAATAPHPDDVAGAFARNTKRAYAADWRDFTAWLGRRDLDASFPVAPAVVRDYLVDRAATVRVSTLRRRLAAIAQAHRFAGVAFDRNAEVIRLALRRLAREYGTAAAGRAEILTADLVAMLERLAGDLRGVRDRALLLVGYAGGFRRSELSGLDAEHITWKRDGILVLIPRSKGDQEGEGQQVGILYGRRPATCPVRALKAWLDAAKITTGAVFRPVIHGRVWAQRLGDKQIWRVVKGHAAAAGLDARMIGAHSLRVGHGTQALANGADPVKLKEHFRHAKLETTLGYNRGRALERGNTSGKLGL